MPSVESKYNIVLQFFLLCWLTLCCFSVCSQDLTNGLIVHYPFDGNTNDISINSLNANQNGGSFVQDRNGLNERAIHFDGIDDFLQFPSNDLLKPTFPVTISMWVRLESSSRENPFFSNDFAFSNYHGFWAQTTFDGTARVAIGFGGGQGSATSSNRRSKNSEIGLSVGEWQQITIIFRGSQDMDIFIGCQDAGGTYSGTGSTTMAYSDDFGGIGRLFASNIKSSPYFQGAMDDFRIWNRELTSNELDMLIDEACCSLPVVDLGEDQLLCYTNSIVLDASYDDATYQWQDGSTNQTFVASETGTYWVEVANGCGIDRDTVTITIEAPPLADLGEDQLLCDTNSIIFDATQDGVSYLWQDGTTNPTFVAVVTGVYWVTVENACGIDQDTVSVIIESPPIIDLGEDQTLCDIQSHTLDATHFSSSYLWNNGSTNSIVNIHESGIYWVTVENNCGVDQDTISLVVESTPSIDFGTDRKFCNDELFVIDVSQVENATYEWSDGSTQSSYEISESGTYWATVENACGIDRDTLDVKYLSSSEQVIPNVFTPNNDSYNEHFELNDHMIGSDLKVFNRNGTLVYHSEKYENNWNGSDLSSGVYYYSIENVCKEPFNGWVQILR